MLKRLVCLAMGLVVAGPATAAVVNCDRISNDLAAVQAAIDAEPDGGTVVLRGTCVSAAGMRVSIARSNIIVRGPLGLPATLVGSPAATVLEVRGSNIVLRDLNLNGGKTGLSVLPGGHVRARNLQASGNAVTGLEVVSTGSLVCAECQSSNNALGVTSTGFAYFCGQTLVNSNALVGVVSVVNGRLEVGNDPMCGGAAPAAMFVTSGGTATGLLAASGGVIRAESSTSLAVSGGETGVAVRSGGVLTCEDCALSVIEFGTLGAYVDDGGLLSVRGVPGGAPPPQPMIDVGSGNSVFIQNHATLVAVGLQAGHIIATKLSVLDISGASTFTSECTEFSVGSGCPALE